MTSKDYNALAAEMMGYETFPPEMEQGLLVAITEDYRMWWNPLENRNQAHQLLKRAEELGLADEVSCEIRAANPQDIDPYAPSDWKEFYWVLICPTEIITMACVDVWEAWLASQNQCQKGHGWMG